MRRENAFISPHYNLVTTICYIYILNNHNYGLTFIIRFLCSAIILTVVTESNVSVDLSANKTLSWLTVALAIATRCF